jgi:hypothetical protein
MEEHPGIFFVGLILFFFLLWIFTGGPTRPISFAGPYITPITNVNQTQVGYGTTTSLRAYVGSSGTQTQSQMSGQLATDQTELGTYQTQAQYNVLFGIASPYKGIVTMDHSVSGTSSNDPSQESIEIHLSSDALKNVDITGWKLESTVTSNNATIGKGTKILHQGSGNILSDIVLVPGNDAIITTGISPVNDSFEENECTGYFGINSYTYSDECPDATTEFSAHYSGNPLADDSCYAYVQTVGQCSVPKNVPSGLTPACDAFLSKYLNYNGCVAAHSGDAHFYGTTWQIYLGYKARLWKNSRDNIKLVDASGKTVDMFTY